MRILVVDDDREIRVLLHAVLEDTELGVELVEAGSGPEALAVLDRMRVDVVLLDVMMPGMDGFEVLAAIRARGQRQPPVVMLTARSAESDHIHAFRAGADAYLVKPFDIDELSSVINDVLARPPAVQVAAREQELGRAELLAQIEARLGN